jgi:mannose/fructose-specific phosphotransferase system component IIA
MVVISHADLCTGIMRSAEMILGPQDAVWTVSLTEEGVEPFEKRLTETIDEARYACDGVLVLADIMHATPFNCAYRYLLGHDDGTVQLVAGYNLPMLAELLVTRSAATDVQAFVRQVVAASKESMTVAETEFGDDSGEEEF